MDVRQLRYFLGVLEAKSFTRAAETLYVAQPAIGMQIRKLEEELGVKLLVRHSRGVVPTQAGEELAKDARALLQDIEQMRQRVMDIGTVPQGQLVVGVTTAVRHLLAADLIRACRDKYPNLVLAIVEGMSQQIAVWMTEKHLDLVLTYIPSGDPEMESEALAEEFLYLIVPAGHPAAERSEITLDEVVEQDLIVSPRWSSLFREVLEDAAEAKGVALRTACEAELVPTIVDLVICGIGCAIMPRGAVRANIDNGEIVALRIVDFPIRRTLYLTYSRRRQNSKARDAVCEEIRALVRQMLDTGTTGWAPVTGSEEKSLSTETRPRNRRRVAASSAVS